MPRKDKLVVAIICVVVGIGTLLALRPTILFDLNGIALSASVERSIDGHSSEPHVSVNGCSPRGAGDWMCIVDRDPGSNALSSIRVHSDDGRCWTGERLLAQVFGKSHRDAGELHGCVRLWDYSGIAL